MAANDIQDGAFNSILYRRFNMREGAPSPTLAPEIVPTVVLENSPLEYAFLAGIRTAARGATTSAVAAQRALFQISNPAGSNALIVVTRAYVSCATGLAGLYWSAFGLSGSAAQLRDSRLTTTNAAAILGTGNTAAVPGNALLLMQSPANTIIDFLRAGEGIVLTPGSAIAITNSTINEAMTSGFVWTERTLLPLER